MKLPFSIRQFLEVFQKYNNAVYPIQILFMLLAALIIFIAFRGSKKHQKLILFILATFWLWMGVVYHIGYFSVINKAAFLFGALFILESILLFIYGLVRPTSFHFEKNIQGILSGILLSYALIVYPLIGYFTGHAYPYSPTFGLPCPTTIFTFALFLIAQPRIPFYIAVVPLLWSAIGFSAAFSLGIYEDTALILSGLAFVLFYFRKTKKKANQE
jgi:hypothetical protein